MNPHDVVAVDGDGFRCRCGKSYPTMEKHSAHFQVERARAALKGDGEGDAG